MFYFVQLIDEIYFMFKNTLNNFENCPNLTKAEKIYAETE